MNTTQVMDLSEHLDLRSAAAAVVPEHAWQPEEVTPDSGCRISEAGSPAGRSEGGPGGDAGGADVDVRDDVDRGCGGLHPQDGQPVQLRRHRGAAGHRRGGRGPDLTPPTR